MGRAGITRLSVLAALGAAAALAVACGHREERDERPAPRAEQAGVPFKLTANRGDFLFEWVDPEGEFRTGTKLGDVPEVSREKVRVEPLSLPPDRRAPPDQVYLADLRRPGKDGVYPVRVVPREDFEALAGVLSSPLPRPGATHPGAPAGPPLPAPPPLPPGATPDVIVYGASWCGACRQAAEWLASHHVPFVDKDIERDPGARAEMERKCRAAGVAPNSIPILDVRGQVLQGFSPGRVARLLGR